MSRDKMLMTLLTNAAHPNKDTRKLLVALDEQSQ